MRIILGETADLRQTISAASAFTISAPAITIYRSDGTTLSSGTPSVLGGGTASQTLSHPFTPAAVGTYYAVFSITVGDETRKFELRVAVEAVPSTGYPTGADLAARIHSLGVLDPDTEAAALAGMALDRKASAAATEFESRVGWNPFLAPAGDADGNTTRYYDPPGPNTLGLSRSSSWTRGGGNRLFLGAGVLSIHTLQTGADDPTTATTLVENEDYYLLPFDAPQIGAPYDEVEFALRQFGAPRSIKVVGKFGFCLAPPDDVFEAVLQWALWLCYPELALAVSKGLYSVRTLNSELRYAGGGMGALSNESAAWQKALPATALRYMRVAM